MGTACSCGNSRPCGGGAEEGPPAPAEYEPAKGAGEEDETLRREDFNPCAQTRPHSVVHAPPDGRDPKAGLTDLGSLSHADTGFLAAAMEDENNEKKDALHAYAATASHVEGEKAKALAELRQLLTRSGVDPVEIEQAMEAARRMEATEHDLDEARSRLEVLRVERAMSQAQAAAAELTTAASRGFEEKPPTDSEMLQRDRARLQEEEANRLAEASALLHLAKADKDIGKLKEAISRAEIDGVEEAELQEARQALAELEKKGGKKKGGCLCGGGGGGDGAEKKKEKKEKADKKAEKAEKASKKDKADKSK